MRLNIPVYSFDLLCQRFRFFYNFELSIVSVDKIVDNCLRIADLSNNLVVVD